MSEQMSLVQEVIKIRTDLVEGGFTEEQAEQIAADYFREMGR